MTIFLKSQPIHASTKNKKYINATCKSTRQFTLDKKDLHLKFTLALIDTRIRLAGFEISFVKKQTLEIFIPSETSLKQKVLSFLQMSRWPMFGLTFVFK